MKPLMCHSFAAVWNLGVKQLKVCQTPRYLLSYYGQRVSCRTFSSFTGSTVTINSKEIVEVTKQNANNFLDKYDTIMLDCDGVLWRPDHITPIPGIGETIQKLQDLGKHILYVTNNSMHCRNNYLAKFREHGFDSQQDDIFCVAYAAAVYLKQLHHIKSKVYVIGSEGMEQELNLAGISNFGVGKDPDPVYETIQNLRDMTLHDDVGAVLVGYDKHFDLTKLFKASSYLSHMECLFLATNYLEKSVFIAPHRLQPVTGAIIDAVISSARRKPDVIGKPFFHLFECITAIHPHIDIERTVMIGDSLKADIGFAKTVGIDSALVLTGVSSLDHISELVGLEPKYFLQTLNMLNV